jgi:hypothetical protein
VPRQISRSNFSGVPLHQKDPDRITNRSSLRLDNLKSCRPRRLFPARNTEVGTLHFSPKRLLSISPTMQAPVVVMSELARTSCYPSQAGLISAGEDMKLTCGW